GVDADGIETAVLCIIDRSGQVLRPGERGIRGCLVHTGFEIPARILSGGKSAGWNRASGRTGNAEWIDHADPWIVEGGVLRVETRAPGDGGAGSQAVIARGRERRLDQGDAIPAIFAIFNECRLYLVDLSVRELGRKLHIVAGWRGRQRRQLGRGKTGV